MRMVWCWTTAACSAQLSTALKGLGGKRLRLELLELLLVNRATVEQALRRRNLFGRIATSRNGLDVLIGGSLRFLHFAGLPFGHAPATCDQVDEGCQEGEDDQENDPDRLPPAAEIPVPEEVSDDVEQHHEVEHKEECPNQEPEEIPETVH
jgi:hypothetical protein